MALSTCTLWVWMVIRVFCACRTCCVVSTSPCCDESCDGQGCEADLTAFLFASLTALSTLWWRDIDVVSVM